MAEYIKVAEKAEIAEGSAKCVEASGKRIALFNLGGVFFAIGDTCTHMGGPLSEGTVEGDEVECPWHGAHFNIKSGKNTCPPAPIEVPKYNVRISGEDIEVEV